MPSSCVTALPQAMPDDVKMTDPLHGYRNYYRTYKRDFAKWTNRQVPEWFNAR